MEKIALLIDEKGDRSNVFEQFAKEFEQSSLEGDLNFELNELKTKVELIERRLQDISEKITVENESEDNIYSFTITKTREILGVWLPLFSNRNLDSRVSTYFRDELDNLLEYLHINNIETKEKEEIDQDFKEKFNISAYEFEHLRKGLDKMSIKELSFDSQDELNVAMLRSILDFIRLKSEHTVQRSILNKVLEELSLEVGSKFNQMRNAEGNRTAQSNQEEIFDSEDVLYTTNLKLWIDTNDAVEANLFMSIVTSALGKIENVEVIIKEVGVGSFWQKIKLMMKGWFAKEETKQIINKTGRAIEAYTVDRHVEPIEKSKTDREKTRAEINNMLSKEQAEQLNEITIESAKEDLKSKKLENVIKRIEITEKLSQLMINGLLTIDSDYRIEINDIMLLEQKNGSIYFNDQLLLDELVEKSIIDLDEDENDSDENDGGGEGSIQAFKPEEPKQL